MKAVILAAGRSERLAPFTTTRAKPMIRVAGHTIMEYMTSNLRAAGVEELIVVVNHQREAIQTYFEHGHHLGLSIEYVVQDPIDGIGAGLRRCQELLGDSPFLLVYGDVLATGAPFHSVIRQHTESGGPVAALTLPQYSGEFGNVYLNNDMCITRLVEKPSDPHLSNYVFAGMFLLTPDVFTHLENSDNEMEQVFQRMIEGGGFQGTLWEGDWIDIRHPWQILQANRMVMSQWETAEVHTSVRLQGSVQVHGPVHIQKNVVVESGSILKGPCFIGEGSYIGNNTLIREYASLGPQSVVGYGSELKNCILFGGGTLGRLSFVGDSVIGEGVHMGTGVTTVNVSPDGGEITLEGEGSPKGMTALKMGAFIGDHARIGARHVMAPGTRIPAGTRVEDLITLRTME